MKLLGTILLGAVALVAYVIAFSLWRFETRFEHEDRTVVRIRVRTFVWILIGAGSLLAAVWLNRS